VKVAWQSCTFGDVVDLEQGLAFNKKNRHFMSNHGIPLLRITNLINDTEDKFVNEKFIREKYIAKREDLIFTRTGQVGLIFRGKIGVVHNNCFRVIPRDGISSGYVYWYLRQPNFRERVISVASGSAQPDITHGAFKSLPFHYPPLPIQNEIDLILSKYDNLIENNTRSIAILEKMSEVIYREWFEKFNFRGHKSTKLIDSPNGLIPKGWEIKKISEIIDFIGGSQPPKKFHIYEERTGYVRFIQNRDYGPKNNLTYIPESRRNKHCQKLDIMVDKYGQAGQTRFGLVGAYNVALAKLLPHKTHHREWLRGLISRPRFRMNLAASSMASTRPSLNKSHFVVNVPVPPDNISQEFKQIIEPINLQILLHKDRIANLQLVLELLLGKLCSGKMDLGEFESVVI
jgi:type I restriction enzyme, S subunit